ncbi:MAG: sn-glycerol-3-phosphate ABC transporter ATP-binding protein UgpC [Burkholderiaceae bacterium]|nr:sn-glycerol-3-phosphate ABC transporter ATP-binding protein UgpC [Burkholderiaceae bacterium]
MAGNARRRAAGAEAVQALASLEIRQARKSFGSVEVLHGVSVPIEDGEFVVLVGPSGCGKSTLLRMIAGLENITAGEILIGDTVVNDVHPKERDIAMVFQNYALYRHMTVGQNMGFSLKLRKTEASVIAERVNVAAEILGLVPYLERFPRQLSGGQRQRVAMGRAIVRKPQVFLFDEPLSNLDAKLRVQMRTEIKELHQRLRTTTVYVTHDQIEAMTMADKIVVMHDGIVEQTGTPLELYDRPANRFVAGFIGSPAMDFLDGIVTTNSGAKLPLANGRGTGLSGGHKVAYGIRPEHLDLTSDTDLGFEAEVIVVEPTGSQTQVFARVGGRPESVRQGLGAMLAVEARKRRQAAADAMEAFRAVRRRRIPRDRRLVLQGYRLRGRRARRRLRRPPAQGIGGGQHRRGPGHVLGAALDAAPVPGQDARHQRRDGLPGQEVRRLGAACRDLRQGEGQVDLHAGHDQRQLHQLPQVLDRESRLQGSASGPGGLPRADGRAEEEQHGRRIRARARLGRRHRVDALAAVVARRQPGRQERQGRDQLARDRRFARVLQEAL